MILRWFVLPRFAEEITIETEALSYNRLFAIVLLPFMMKRESRNHSMMEPLFSWTETVEKSMLLNLRLWPYQSDFDKNLSVDQSMSPWKSRSVKDYHVRFTDLDMNGHVNNSKYLDWIFEVMEADF